MLGVTITTIGNMLADGRLAGMMHGRIRRPFKESVEKLSKEYYRPIVPKNKRNK